MHQLWGKTPDWYIYIVYSIYTIALYIYSIYTEALYIYSIYTVAISSIYTIKDSRLDIGVASTYVYITIKSYILHTTLFTTCTYDRSSSIYDYNPKKIKINLGEDVRLDIGVDTLSNPILKTACMYYRSSSI